MLLKIHPENPSKRHLNIVKDVLMDGGIIVYPTDTIYGFACMINNQKALNKIASLKKISPKKANFTLVFDNISDLANYTKPISNSVFKILKRSLPGPYTFILESNNKTPKLFSNKKKQIGIRIPDNLISRKIVSEIGSPLVSTSVKNEDDEILEYIVNPELIHEKYNNQVDLVIDGGYGENTPSTIVNCINQEIEIIREGKGDINLIY